MEQHSLWIVINPFIQLSLLLAKKNETLGIARFNGTAAFRDKEWNDLVMF